MSPCREGWVSGQFCQQVAAQQASLHFHDPSVADGVAEDGMGDQGIQAAFEGPHHSFASFLRQGYGAGTVYEIALLEFAVVEQPQRGRSASTGRNSSARSRANAGRPYFGRW